MASLSKKTKANIRLLKNSNLIKTFLNELRIQNPHNNPVKRKLN
jgi:hypothetical protein